MSLERLKVVADQIAARVTSVKGLGEQATKQALVLPMLDALGYDIWNPAEVCPEYDSDFAIKKAGQKEKVDLAVLMAGQPRIFFEVKPADMALDGHQGQLARYFNAMPCVSLAILTNGVEYRLFTDTGDPNVMDSSPFYISRLDQVDQGLEVLSRFHKSVFSPGAIREFATELNYTAKMVSFLRSELDLRERDPSENLVRWILAGERMYEGRVTSNVVDRFAVVTKNALQIVLRDIVRRSIAAMDQVVSTTQAPSPKALEVQEAEELLESTDPVAVAAAIKSRIVTTEKELECFAVAKAQFEASPSAASLIFDASARRTVPTEISYKDTTGYLAIYLNKPSWWCMRVVTEARNAWIGFNVDPAQGALLLPHGFSRMDPHPYAEFRVGISSPNDLNALGPLAFASFRKTVDDRIRDKELSESAGHQ